MKSAITDCLIHIDEKLPGVGMASIADDLAGNACVSGACVSEHAPHLIMVRYDADCTRARSLVDQVRERGVNAEVVGL